MPTPTRFFHDVAARHGQVDPTDSAAVQHWFTEVLPTLPIETIEEIFESLLENDGPWAQDLEAGEREGDPTDQGPSTFHPQRAPLPSLSSSPPAPVPLLAAGWRELLKRLLRRR